MIFDLFRRIDFTGAACKTENAREALAFVNSHFFQVVGRYVIYVMAALYLFLEIRQFMNVSEISRYVVVSDSSKQGNVPIQILLYRFFRET